MDEKILDKLHNVEVEMLQIIDNICANNNLKYYLIGGTLLGAVRHKGFIPWDDDIDIAMPRNDYERFIKLCNEGALGSEYIIHHITTDNRYWLPYAKVRKNNTLFDEQEIKHLNCHKGIFVDVFPLDYSKKNSGLMYKYKAELIKNLTHVIFERVLKAQSVSWFSKMLYYCTRLLTIKFIARVRDYISASNKVGRYYINYASTYKYTVETTPIEYYGVPIPVSFEEKIFYAPKKSELILEQVYGDYMKMPPENERRNHNPAKIIFDTRSYEQM